MKPWQIQKACEVMSQGGVVAYPTEAVWGLGCDPFNEAAVQRLLAIKHRPEHKGLILVASSIEQIQPLLDGLSSVQRAELDATWPGPNTWLLPDPKNFIPRWIKGQHSSVAVRVSDHLLVKSLCERWGGPVVSTSANRSTALPARSKLKVMTYFGSNVDYILNGATGGADKPSTIRSILDFKVVRM